MVTEVRAEQSLKVAHSIVVTEFGIVTETSFSHPKMAPPPMLFTELGIVIVFKAEQPENACSPILVTEFGIVIDFTLVQ